MKYIIKTLALLLLISFRVDAQQPAGTIPDFKFYKLDKTVFTSKSLNTSKMLFFVFFDVGCDHCQHAIQYLNQHYAEFSKTAMFLITLDSQEKITQFLAKYGNNLKGKRNVTILQDSQNEFIRKFGPRKYPSLFLYSARKKLMLYDDNEQNLVRFSYQIKSSGK